LFICTSNVFVCRYGLNIWTGVDITITGLTIDHTGGDGICTGAGTEGGDRPGARPPGTRPPWIGRRGPRTKNVVIRNCTLSNNHRQGISVISAEGLLVEDCVMSGTNGTAPEAGVDIEADNPSSILVDIVFRRCQFIDNNGCGVEMNIGSLERGLDAPMSILFEDCDISWREDYPFMSPFFDGAGYAIDSGNTGGSITVRGGSVKGSAGAGISIYNKHLSGPTLTFADVTLMNTGRVDSGFQHPWVHATPIMLMDGNGGLGGIWFESVKVVMAASPAGSAIQPFLSYNQWACTAPAPPWSEVCPNVTGDIGGDIEVQWRGNDTQCTPRLLSEGVLLVNGSVFGHELLKNVSIGCTIFEDDGSPAPARQKTDDGAEAAPRTAELFALIGHPTAAGG
jgi:hypothetical protein